MSDTALREEVERVLRGWERDAISPLMMNDDWIVCRRRDCTRVRASLDDVLAITDTIWVSRVDHLVTMVQELRRFVQRPVNWRDAELHDGLVQRLNGLIGRMKREQQLSEG